MEQRYHPQANKKGKQAQPNDPQMLQMLEKKLKKQKDNSKLSHRI